MHEWQIERRPRTDHSAEKKGKTKNKVKLITLTNVVVHFDEQILKANDKNSKSYLAAVWCVRRSRS